MGVAGAIGFSPFSILRVLGLAVAVVAGAATAWPRTPAPTQLVYAADGQSHVYHKRLVVSRSECPYEPMHRFATEAEARAAGLRRCPVCFPNK